MVKRTLISILLVAFVFSAVPKPAHALDKRLRLTFKTALYGAGAGLAIGAGTAALGIGDFKNMLMGASAGMYAGIIFAGYLIATQPDPNDRSHGPRDPYPAKRPVNDEDWEDEDNDDDVIEENIKRTPDSSRATPRLMPGVPAPGSIVSAQRPRPEIGIWAPLVALQF